MINTTIVRTTMTSRLAMTATTILLCVSSCRPAKDSYIVIHSDVNCDVPRVFQLRVTITNSGRQEQKTFPQVASKELGFPSTISLVLPNSRSGEVDLLVEALDNKPQIIGQGTVSGTIAVGGRIDLQVQLVALGSALPLPDASIPPVDSGGSANDGGTTMLPDLGPASVGLPFTQVALGGQSTCALRTDSSLWCWGSNSYGQILLSSTSSRLTPVQLVGIAWSQVSCGQTHSCALRSDATLSCWGNNGSGQLGATTSSLSSVQTEVPGALWQSVATGSYQSCGIMTDGTLWCWGDNTNGQLGIGSTLPATAPTQVAGQGWSQVSTKYLHTCAVKQDGTLWCWGLNSNLQIGSSSVSFSVVPSQLAGTGWTQVTTGLYHSCGMMNDGTVWCWGGNNSGQLGNASIPTLSTAQTSDPVQVTGGPWKNVSAGQSHTCAVALDGSLWCWGDNSRGQLGDKTQTLKPTPVSISVSGQTWVTVLAGTSHTCALAASGSLWCWGDNTAGQLGIGSNEARLSPARVVQ